MFWAFGVCTKREFLKKKEKEEGEEEEKECK